MPPALTYALIGAWVALALVGISSLAVPHMAAMPAPGWAPWGPQESREAKLGRAFLELRQRESGRFLVHVIYERCSCTERLFTHLVARGAFGDADELVVFVGGDSSRRHAATSAGFRYIAVSAEDLAARFGLEAAPVLLAFDAAGRLRYAGGYFDHPATLKALDESIHARVSAGELPRPLPIFGCAVSPKLQDSVDPLGLVYRRG